MSLEESWPDEERREAALVRLLQRCLADRRSTNGRGAIDRRRRYYRPPPSLELTDKELLVLKALSHGLTLIDAADVTGFKYEWCKEALKNIKRKLGAMTRIQAVAIAIRLGLIP